MEIKKVYEYVVSKDWFDNLEPKTRLYFDYSKNGYVYHYETERTSKNNRYEMKTIISEDYFISTDVANRNIELELLIAGPELGDLELKDKN